MDVNMIITLIGSVGFPIVACGAMAYYVKYITDKNREQVDAIMKQHQTEMNSVTDAVNNNTVALQKLLVFLGKDDDINEQQ